MAFNLFANTPASLTAKQTVSFIDCGFNPSNIYIIYKTGAIAKTYDPNRDFNLISGFEENQGYYIVPKANIDLSTVVGSPINIGYISSSYIIPNQYDFNNCVYFKPYAINSKVLNAFSFLEYDTDADSIVISAVSQLVGKSLTGANGISVFINGSFVQRISPTVNDAIQVFTIALTSYEGLKNIKIITSTSESNTFTVSPVKIAFPEFSFVVPIRRNNKTNQLITITDSIGVGVGSSVPEIYSYAALLREEKSNWDITLIGTGGAKFSDFFSTDNLPGTISRCAGRLSGAVRKRLYIALGTNDYGASTPLATIEGYLINALDSFFEIFPDIKIFVQTPTLVLDETSAMNTLRSRIASVVSTRSFCTLVNGVNLVTTAKLIDGVHPNDAGYVDIKNGLLSTALFN